MGIDCLLFSSQSGDPMFDVLAQGHAAANCYWISVSVARGEGQTMSSGVIGPDGYWIERFGCCR